MSESVLVQAIQPTINLSTNLQCLLLLQIMTVSPRNMAQQAEQPFPREGFPFGSINIRGQVIPIRLHSTLPIYMAISIVSGLRFSPIYAGRATITTTT